MEFPEMLHADKSEAVDVHIRLGAVPPFPDEGTQNERLWITPDEFLMRFTDVAIFYAKKGSLVIADVNPAADKKTVRLYLLCNAMAAIVHQRKLIPLHCSGVICKGGVALMVGHSGAGKSTTLKALSRQGHAIFTDDVAVLKNDEGCIHAIPSYPMMKLWEHSFDLLKLGKTNDNDKLNLYLNKYSVFFHGQFISEWKQVLKIFHLAKDENTTEVLIKKLKGIGAFKIIAENTYRNYYVEPMKLNAVHFEMVSSLFRQSEVYTITRPATADSIDEVVKIIEMHL